MIRLQNIITEPAILSTAYFPNIQYFSKFLLHKEIFIEIHETYAKQSYRNRCTILGANGPLNLVIPVIKPNGNNTKTKDIRIQYEENWQMNHWRAIRSAYRHSPFFEIFEDELAPLFYQKIKYLVDWNQKIINQLFTSVGYSKEIKYTIDFVKPGSVPYDFRNSINPKARLQQPDPNYKILKYFQVFGIKHGFTSGLSFIDLLFNEGPEALFICKSSCSV